MSDTPIEMGAFDRKARRERIARVLLGHLAATHLQAAYEQHPTEHPLGNWKRIASDAVTGADALIAELDK